MKRIVLLFIGLACLLALSSCATLFTKGVATIPVTSNVSDAEVYVNGAFMGVTPLELELKTKDSYKIDVSKDGYNTQTFQVTKHLKWGWQVLDLATYGIGNVVDLIMADGYYLKPTEIHANLSFVGLPIIEKTIEGDDVADVSITPGFEGTQTTGYSLLVSSKSDSIIKIVWEKSAIYYAGKSATPFIEGQKYIDSNTPMAPTTIPAHGVSITSIYSADQVYFSSGDWKMMNIPTYETQVIICIECNGKDTYYTFTIEEPTV